MTNTTETHCREMLRKAGQPYPRSGCPKCGMRLKFDNCPEMKRLDSIGTIADHCNKVVGELHSLSTVVTFAMLKDETGDTTLRHLRDLVSNVCGASIELKRFIDAYKP